MESFERLKAWIAKPKDPLPPPDTRLALGVLLVRVAKADKVYLFEELEQIDRVLARLNGINALQAAKLRAMCERLEEAISDTAAFANLLRTYVAYEQRVAMIEALWQVVIADGIEQRQELALVEWVQSDLGVEQKDCEAARAKAFNET